jgi:hypothetical protein
LSRNILSQKSKLDQELVKYGINTEILNSAMNKTANALKEIFENNSYVSVKQKIIDQVRKNPQVITLPTLQQPKTAFRSEIKYSAYEFATKPTTSTEKTRKSDMKYVIEKLADKIPDIQKHINEVQSKQINR